MCFQQALMVLGRDSLVEVLLQSGACLWTAAWSPAPPDLSLLSTGTTAPTLYCSSNSSSKA